MRMNGWIGMLTYEAFVEKKDDQFQLFGAPDSPLAQFACPVCALGPANLLISGEIFGRCKLKMTGRIRFKYSKSIRDMETGEPVISRYCSCRSYVTRCLKGVPLPSRFAEGLKIHRLKS